ncbi:MAG: M23 family metallopeptidase [Dehalococcoidia bacterium]|nr:M23 family metallopeptidase [Dehalococcoidia bacterium]
MASVTIVAALLPPLHVPGVPDAPHASLYPAPPGYLLPWTGGEIHGVTQGEDTSFTHNGAAAYAFDFDLNYETVVAARSGKVTMVKADSNSGGCNSSYSSQTNYVVIDHGDGTSAAYMHLAYRGVLVKPGDLVEQGQPIAVSGETGVTCSADGTGPGPHLHLQVERTQPGQYFTQSLPIAFDDVSTTNGVPREGQSYVSENFGGGKAQTVKLTPRRVPRVFNPVARPKYPMLQEAPPPPPPTTATASPIGTAQPSQTTTPTAVPSTTLTPEASATLTATSTPVASATPTPQATDTPTPAATSTPTAATPTTPPDTPTAPPAPATAPTSGQDPSGAATSPPA